MIFPLQIALSHAGLYDENDEVLILNENNFDENIVGSSNAWIVEFYNSWCGHCIRFAPFWKNLANDCKGMFNFALIFKTMYIFLHIYVFTLLLNDF